MTGDRTPATLQAVYAAFESLKADFRDGRLPVIAGRMAGAAAVWGERLSSLYRTDARADLQRRDMLTRFWVLRYRGMPEPADLTGAPSGAVFVMAFTSFPYLDVLMDSWGLGDLTEPAEAMGPFKLQCLLDGVDEGFELTAEKAPAGGWRFDLMPLYHAKALALETFVSSEFGGDFDRFFAHYVAEHDLDFHMDQAWAPLTGA
ncbi:conserved hypothetical protein [Candidatus Terasakiella magnetica]|nr:conserved hypothetical protein [Candidatus Terasakiella magnetica]